jgi:PAS domain-containing protein
MKAKWNSIEQRISLRALAEAMVSGLSPKELDAKPNELLFHELLVHKVELEMQHEELRRAHNELEEARDRFIDLYEFAPVAYITVNREGLIKEINLTGSTVLGVDRVKLLKSRFSQFNAHLHCLHWLTLDATPMLRIALMGISKIS